MPKKVRIDMTGQRYGSLIAVEYVGSRSGHALWKCICDCGNEVIVQACHLRSGHTQSCGCLHDMMAGNLNKTHGKRKTRLYRIWLNMKNRCGNPLDACYKHYGCRGITVCDEWKNDFQAFYDWAMANGYKEDLSIDRIDVNGNYEPNNCRWATTKEQANNKRTNRCIEAYGEKHTIKEWAEILNINYCTLYSRFKMGWDAERALQPSSKERRCKNVQD